MGWKIPTFAVILATVALAVGGVAVGLAIHGATGALLGVIPGALAGVTAGYVPAIRDRAEQRRARHADARRALAAVSEPPDVTPPGPAALLRPEQAVVDFTGRDAELAVLRDWCAAGPACAVQVITGAGGVGKTRLARHAAASCHPAGGTWQFVAAGHEAGAVTAARAAATGPVLLIIDYAETRTGLGQLLATALTDPGPLRILLLARTLGEWWDRLAEDSAYAAARLLTQHPPIHLDVSLTDSRTDAELAAAAVPRFAAALHVPPPPDVGFQLPGQRVPVLVLHTAALVAVLRSAAPDAAGAQRVQVEDAVLGELLEHEARYWRRTATARGLPDDGTILKPLTAAAVLLGAPGLDDAAALASRIPDLTGTPPGRQRTWARWLYDLYPPGPDGQLGSLQPDLLAETHAATQLTADPALARHCLTGLTGLQAEHALTVLARAWTHHPAARAVLVAALRDDLPGLAIPAARVTLQTSPPLAVLLTDALHAAPAGLDALTAIAHALPYPSVALAPASLAVTQRVRAALPADTAADTTARWAVRAGAMFSALGRPADALPAERQAVAVYRELAAADPDRYRPGLATCLSNLGGTLSGLGRPADALPLTQEAVAIHRELAAASPGRYRADLAGSLTNLGVWLSDLGRPADALPVTQEAVAIHRELAAASPDRYRPDLARSLTNLGIQLWELGHSAAALPVAQEAVASCRELAAASPDRYRPELASSLDSLAVRLSAVGRPAAALPVAQEAVAIRRELAAASPARFRPDLARSLTNLGIQLWELRRPADALPLTWEAVASYRELAAASPDRYRPELATSLNSLGIWLAMLGQRADALPVIQEAVAIRRELAAASPDRYRADLAGALANLGIAFAALGRPADALPVARQAVATYRELAGASPDRHRPHLADALNNLGRILGELGRLADALPVTREAVASYRELAAASPDRHRRGLATALNNLAAVLSLMKRDTQAQDARAEAQALVRER